jgi:DNA-binding CsgD family transcriptional regulator
MQHDALRRKGNSGLYKLQIPYLQRTCEFCYRAAYLSLLPTDRLGTATERSRLMGSHKPDKTLLSPREAEIQELHELGLSPHEIAARLGIAHGTVHKHLRSIRERATGAKEKHVDDEPFFATGFTLPPDLVNAIVNNDTKEK